MSTPALTDEIRAGCKINLSLSITGVREDGYHLLDSIFWPLQRPYDTLTFHASAGQEFSVSCSKKGIDVQNNTLTKAYEAFIHAGGALKPQYGKVHVHLHKGIPHGAGLGGGSSDAAAVLTWCNAHALSPLSTQQLHNAAVRVGADVPFFLQNVPARVQGIGEILHTLPQPWPQGYVILLCPKVYISTPWAYKKIDEEKSATFSKNMLTKSSFAYRTLFTGAGQESTEPEWSKSLAEGNDFESVVFAAHPQLAKLKQSLLDNGAALATLSGSGSSIVGIVKNKEAAQKLADKLKSTQCRVFVTTL